MSLHAASTPEALTPTPQAKINGGIPLADQSQPPVGNVPQQSSSNSQEATSLASLIADPAKSKDTKDIKKDATGVPTNTKGLHTVFIHKLYNMLEDEDLKHLIWWTSSNESFVIVPGEEFSRALSQYFKHTNVASFVRQLNMYGFHKVSELPNIPTDSSEVATWEFRHSSGSFRKGDVDSLNQIKRRSSKHASGRTTHMDPGLLSDTEISSERSNSVTEYPQDLNVVDPMLSVRLAELGHNLGALRHEHARLQLRYDTAISDMRKTNLDMVYLLDIMQKLIHSNPNDQDTQPDSFASPKPHQLTTQIADDMASPGSAVRQPQPQLQPQPYSLQDVERDISRFRASIIQRAATKEQFDQFSVPFAPSYQMDQIPKSNHPPPQQHLPTQHGNQSPADTSAMNSANPEANRYPNPYPYPYPPQFQQFPSSHTIHPHGEFPGAAPGPLPSHIPNHDQQIVQDPFRADRKSSRSSNRSRNMSILCDPLQPPAMPAMISPASSGIPHRGSFNGQPNDQNGYFPDHKLLQGLPRTHTPEPPQVAYKMSPVAPPGIRDQRAGSFPGIAPVIQNALRGEGLIRKRRGSGDVMDIRGMDNPPRSVPDDGFGAPPMPRKSLSATNISEVKSTPPPNSGVYALLNPDRRDSTSSQSQPKKARNA